MWQDDFLHTRYVYKWDDAKKKCDQLTLGDYSDWRLPDYHELLSIIDYSRKNPAIKNIFQNTASGRFISCYWSSSQSVADSDNAWRVRFDDAWIRTSSKSYRDAVRCVRGKQ